MRASRGAAWIPLASRSTTFDAKSVATSAAPLMPNFAAAPLVKPTVMAAFLLVILSLITPGAREGGCSRGLKTGNGNGMTSGS